MRTKSDSIGVEEENRSDTWSLISSHYGENQRMSMRIYLGLEFLCLHRNNTYK